MENYVDKMIQWIMFVVVKKDIKPTSIKLQVNKKI